MYNVLIVLIGIAAILMTLIVLIQESKGGGLASGFAASNSIMGVRRTTDLIEKTTWGLAIAIAILSVAASYALPSASDQASVVMQQGANLPTMPVNNAGQVPSAAQQAQPAQGAAATQGAQAPAQGAETPAAN